MMMRGSQPHGSWGRHPRQWPASSRTMPQEWLSLGFPISPQKWRSAHSLTLSVCFSLCQGHSHFLLPMANSFPLPPQSQSGQPSLPRDCIRAPLLWLWASYTFVPVANHPAYVPHKTPRALKSVMVSGRLSVSAREIWRGLGALLLCMTWMEGEEKDLPYNPV